MHTRRLQRTLILTTAALILIVPVALAAARDIAVWNFEDLNTTVDVKDAAVSSATAAGGSGLTSESFPTTDNQGSAGAWSFAGWTSGSRDDNDYFQFAVDLTHFGGITYSFDERRSGTGIRDWEVRYSIDGGVNFTTIGTGNVPDDTNWRSHSIPVASGSADDLAMRGQSNVIFRLYGFTAEGALGTWRVDNVKFYATTGPNAITLRTLTATAPLSPWAVALPALGLVAAARALVAKQRSRGQT